MDTKFCNYCQIDHPVTKEYWYFCKNKPSGCKKYRTESRRSYVKKNREKILNYLKDYHKNNYIKNKENLSEYGKKYRKINKEYLINKSKDYYLKNKEKIQKKHKEYRDNNKERIKLYNKIHQDEKKEYYKQQKKEYFLRTKEQRNTYLKEYNIKNKDKIKKRQNLYEKNRKKIDPEYNLRKILRLGFYIHLRKSITSKNEYHIKKNKLGSVLSYLGMEISNFVKYIESLWQEGMSWSNYGSGKDKWNIDHIYPLSLGDCTNPEFLKKVWHYTNLRPLWHIENIKKSNKIIEDICDIL